MTGITRDDRLLAAVLAGMTYEDFIASESAEQGGGEPDSDGGYDVVEQDRPQDRPVRAPGDHGDSAGRRDEIEGQSGDQRPQDGQHSGPDR